MILKSIEVSGWRCFVETVCLGPFCDGLNVIFAPNGSGKSTLFEALCRGLLDGHRVTGKDVEALRPWGRLVSPEVAIEFSHAGSEYRFKKRFLDGASSVLEQKENGLFRKTAENDPADERVRGLLTRNPPGRGLSQPRNWGIAQVLWAPQGKLALAELTGDLANDIRSMLGAQVAGAASGAIEARVAELYGRYFTPGGRLRSGKDGAPVVQLTNRLEKAKERLRQARERQIAFEEASRRVDDLKLRLEERRQQAEELRERLKDLREQARGYERLVGERERRSEMVESAEARHRGLREQIELITRKQGDLEKARKDAAESEADLPVAMRECQTRERELEAAKTALEEARGKRESAEEATSMAGLGKEFVALTAALRELRQKIEKVERARKRQAEAEEELKRLVAPSDRELKAIRKLLAEQAEVKTKLDASLITLEVIPERAGNLRMIAGEERGEKKLLPGEPVIVKGSPEVVAEIAGVAKLRSRGPAGSAEEWREALKRVANRLAKKTAPFGTDNIEQLEALRDSASRLEKQAGSARTEIAALLGNYDLEDLFKERTAKEATLARILTRNPQWEKKPPDVSALVAEAEDLATSSGAELQAAESAWQQAQTALAGAKQKVTELNGRATFFKEQVQRLCSDLAELTEGKGKSLAERQAELQKMAMAWDAAKGKLAEIEGELGQFDGDPRRELDQLDRQLEAVSEEANQALGAEREEQGRLEQMAAGGPYSELARAEEEVTAIQDELSREELFTNAISLLYDTLSTVKSEAVATVLGPVEKAATRTFHRIAGRRLGRIRIDESFSPAAVEPQIVEVKVDIRNLSGGETEQLYLATRLALAEVLARDERQLVVLDDVLTATDSGRLARVMTVLEEAAERLQLLILTCHPERYRGLAGAHFFDLKEAANEAVGASS